MVKAPAGGMYAKRCMCGSLREVGRCCQAKIYANSSALNSERVKFEIAGGNYRPVAAFHFRRQIAFVKFVGTHGAPGDRGLLGAAEGTEEGDKLEVLVALVELYEAKRWPAESGKSFDPIDVLRYAVEELGHTQAELGELLGSRSRASGILSRRRPLTVEMIHKISETWKIPADLLVRPYKLARAA